MILNLGSLAFNAGIDSGGGTPAWGTELGQGEGYKFVFEDMSDFFTGMVYRSVSDIDNVTCPLGKGGNQRADYDFVIASLFDKVFVNGKRVSNARFLLLVVKKLHGDHHVGRRTIKYNPRMTYRDEYINEDCYKKMTATMGLPENAAWFVYEIFIVNQDELHFTAFELGEKPQSYRNTEERKNAFLNRLPKEGKRRYKLSTQQDCHLQQIFYGAPGTGKSHEISKRTESEAVVRTTFHPDSDYSTFVGAYKPVMRDVDVPVVPVVVNSGIGLKPAGTYTEKRITYQFVKQAFLKAYLGAWKKYADGCSICSAPAVREFDTGNGRYVINSVGVYDLTLSREFSFPKTLVAKEWPNLWINGEFKVPKGPQTGKSVQHAISNWIFGKINECTQDKFEEGWQLLVDTVKKNGHVDVQKTQTYIITKVSDDNETLTVIAEARNKKRATLRSKFYDSNEVKLSKLERTLVNILKRYNSDFDEAWELLKQNVNKGETPEFKDDSNGQIDPQYLIIEEINRGNCAQIFGDIFQLLDRGDNGFSVYPIEADSDLRDAIKEAFTDEEEFRLSSSLDIDDVIEYTSNYEATLSEDVENGRVLLLPPNLYIWATMNTSDQSLFPIDSAFKRRWDWVYMPIGYKNTNWTIEIGDKKYKWVEFQRIINDKIYGVDNSEDKQLGDYFVNADRTNEKISADTLLNKVLFYIWNDVCKDDPDQIFQWVNDKKQNESIKFSDFFGVDKDKKLQGFMAYNKVPAIGETDNTDNADNTNIQEETPAENDNEINS